MRITRRSRSSCPITEAGAGVPSSTPRSRTDFRSTALLTAALNTISRAARWRCCGSWARNAQPTLPGRIEVKCRHAMPFGAELLAAGATRFRLWAPAAKRVMLETGAGEVRCELSMAAADGGWFEAIVPDTPAGTRD